MGGERTEGARKVFGRYSRNFSGFSTEQRLSLYVSPHSERNTEKRVHLGQVKGRFSCQKGAPKLDFHREGGGSCLHLPPKSATECILKEEHSILSQGFVQLFFEGFLNQDELFTHGPQQNYI